jgi:hypothetical protein
MIMTLAKDASKALIEELRTRSETLARLREEAKEQARHLAALADLAPKDLPSHRLSKTWCIQHGIEFRLVDVATKEGRNREVGMHGSRKTALLKRSYVYHAREMMLAVNRLERAGIRDGDRELLRAHWEALEVVMDRVMGGE